MLKIAIVTSYSAQPSSYFDYLFNQISYCLELKGSAKALPTVYLAYFV